MKMPGTAAPLEIQTAINNCILEAKSKWMSSMLSDYTELIIEGLKFVGSPGKLGINADAMAALLMRDTPLWGTYADMSGELSRAMNAIVIESFANPEAYGTKKLMAALKDKAHALADYRLEAIARTESSAVVNKGRELAWRKDDPRGERTYQFLHPDLGFRSHCPLCEAIVKEIGKGKSLDGCKAIIKRLSVQYNGPKWKPRDWSAHPQCLGNLVQTSLVED